MTSLARCATDAAASLPSTIALATIRLLRAATRARRRARRCLSKSRAGPDGACEAAPAQILRALLRWSPGAPVATVIGVYNSYALGRAFTAPMNSWAGLAHCFWSDPRLPLTGTPLGRAFASAGELVERATRHFSKPPFALAQTRIGGRAAAVREV